MSESEFKENFLNDFESFESALEVLSEKFPDETTLILTAKDLIQKYNFMELIELENQWHTNENGAEIYWNPQIGVFTILSKELYINFGYANNKLSFGDGVDNFGIAIRDNIDPEKPNNLTFIVRCGFNKAVLKVNERIEVLDL